MLQLVINGQNLRVEPAATPINTSDSCLSSQAVAVLKFSDDGHILLSGGDDTVASAWLLMEVLDASASQSASQPPQPFHSWCAVSETQISSLAHLRQS